MAAKVRVSNFAFVQLVENLPETWKQIIDDWHVKAWAIQHEPDNETGKDHIHCVVHLDSQVALSTALDMVAPLNVKHVEIVRSLRSYCRYLLHMDNPEKKQYKLQDLHLFAGADVAFADDPHGQMLGFFDLYNHLQDLGIYTTVKAMKYIASTGDVRMMDIFYRDLLKFDRLLKGFKE